MRLTLTSPLIPVRLTVRWTYGHRGQRTGARVRGAARRHTIPPRAPQSLLLRWADVLGRVDECAPGRRSLRDDQPNESPSTSLSRRFGAPKQSERGDARETSTAPRGVLGRLRFPALTRSESAMCSRVLAHSPVATHITAGHCVLQISKNS